MNVKQISVMLNNRSGALHEMTGALADNGISIRAITVANSDKFSEVRIIVDNVIWASSVLTNAGFNVSCTDVVALEVQNIPGGLDNVLEVLKNGYVNIEYLYHVGRKYNFNLANSMCIIFKFTDNDKAVNVLSNAGIKMLGHGDLAVM